MKKILVAVFVSTLAISFAPAAVLAADISNTGPGSYNSIINEETREITVTCNNDVEVVNINNQSSNSGSAVVDGNSYAGDAQSGNSENLNDFVATLGVSCAPATLAVVNPPAEGGKGGGTTTTPQVQAATTTLPDTGAEMVAVSLATALVLGTASAIATQKFVSDEN